MFIQRSKQKYRDTRLLKPCANNVKTSVRTSNIVDQSASVTKNSPDIAQNGIAHKTSHQLRRSKLRRRLSHLKGPEAQLRSQMVTLAQDKAGFHATIKQVYGDNYRVKKAESLRQQSLNGNFNWLPAVCFVHADTLSGANGTYDFESETLLLNVDLAGAGQAAQAFIREAGKHLDTVLNIQAI